MLPEYSAAGKRDRQARGREQQDRIKEADKTGCGNRQRVGQGGVGELKPFVGSVTGVTVGC
jgi:hypothetical protein